MYAAAIARRVARTLVVPARVRRLAPPVLAFSRHLDLDTFERDEPPALSTTAKLDAFAAMEDVWASAHKARSSLPFDDALARVQDILQEASKLRPDQQLFLQLMLGKDIYKLSDLQRISETLRLTPDHRTWTVAINNAIHMRDLDEALALYDEAWAQKAAPRNSAAKSIIRALVYPQNGGTFSGVRDVQLAVGLFTQQLHRSLPLRGEKPDVPLELHPLMSAVVANPGIPRRRNVIEDILHAFHERGWKLQPGLPNVSDCLDLVYRCSSHAEACKRTTHAKTHRFTRDERWRVLYHIATMRFDPERVMPGTALREYAKYAAEDGIVINHGLFVAYLHALRDMLPPGTVNPAALAAVRDAEDFAVRAHARQAQHALLYRALLNAYGRMSTSAGVLRDLRRAWRWLAAQETISEGAVIDTLRAFPPSTVREVWDERAARPERIGPRLWAIWVEVLCRMGEVDEAYAVYATQLRDKYSGTNAGGVLFAAARSAEEQETWAQEFPRTWASVRTQRHLQPLTRESSDYPP